jgi:hypothetical protein
LGVLVLVVLVVMEDRVRLAEQEVEGKKWRKWRKWRTMERVRERPRRCARG